MRALLQHFLLALVGVSLLQGCASPDRLAAVPLDHRTEAVLPGMARVRYLIDLNAQRDGLDYNLAVIPPDFTAPHREEFDTEYMGQLFDFARRLARQGYSWQKLPPGYVTN